MGFNELIESIVHEGEKNIAAVRDDADSQIEKIKAERERRAGELRDKYAIVLRSEIAAVSNEILLKAEREARETRLRAEAQLSSRLYSIAMSMLGTLRDKTYDSVFYSLLHELPSHKWEKLSVNRLDETSARNNFPEAEITIDNTITGGIQAFDGNARLMVCNTLESRLNKAWKDMLPDIIRDVRSRLALG